MVRYNIVPRSYRAAEMLPTAWPWMVWVRRSDTRPKALSSFALPLYLCRLLFRKVPFAPFLLLNARDGLQNIRCDCVSAIPVHYLVFWLLFIFLRGKLITKGNVWRYTSKIQPRKRLDLSPGCMAKTFLMEELFSPQDDLKPLPQLRTKLHSLHTVKTETV